MSHKTAVLYLRVSTASQVGTDEHDPDGYSLNAQRQACYQKATSMGMEVIEEYVERGESGTKASTRPELQKMLKRIKEGGVDALVVHKVDRLARNRADDALIGLELKAAGTQLVSCSENIDGTPQGKLIHGIFSTLAEFYSANLSTEILKGMDQKAQQGGTPFKAPIGYKNERRFVDGKEIRTIALDSERAPLVQHAFEAYSTGEYSLSSLLEELTEMGLTSKPTPSRPAKALQISHLQKILNNPYYIGIVEYRGDRHEGRHEPLVSVEIFETVRDVLTAHLQSGERTRTRDHYLKGTLTCGRCGRKLSYTHSVGRGGEYAYFYCLAKSKRRDKCSLPYLDSTQVEVAVERYYLQAVTIPQALLERVGINLGKELSAIEATGNEEVNRQRKVVVEVEKRRRELSLKSENGVIPDDIAKERQNELSTELVKAKSYMRKIEAAVIDVEANLGLALDILREAGDSYGRAGPALRRRWNQALFDQISIDIDANQSPTVDQAPKTEPFDRLTAWDTIAHYSQENPDPVWDGVFANFEEALDAREAENERTLPIQFGKGSNKNIRQ